MTASILRAEGVNVAFAGVKAVQDVSLSIAQGSITGLIGPNGSGKSTLIDVLSGIRRPASGAVYLKAADITGLPVHQRASNGLVRTFQLSRDLPSLTVLENLLLAWPGHPGEGLLASLFGSRAARDAEALAHERARQMLERINLQSLADRPAAALSGGQKKLLDLARALMMEPEVLLLDEPAAGVSPALLEPLCEFIAQLRSQGTSVLLVEHNMEVVATLCDSLYVLAAGEVVCEGSFAQVCSDARVIDAYLGA